MIKSQPFVLENELSYKLQGIFIEISKEYSYLFKEGVYYNILKEKLLRNNLQFNYQARIDLYSQETGELIGNYVPDFVIENKIILEIKAQKNLEDSHINQLIRYLKLSKYEIGYLVNFGCPKVQMIRRIYNNDRKK